MKKYLLIIIWIVLIAMCLSSSEKIVTVWLIGDSTMADYSKYDNYQNERYPITGWGQVFQSLMTGTQMKELKDLIGADSIIVDDRAVGGRSTRTFFQEGKWRQVYESLKPGDFVLMQFGHNDQSESKIDRYVNIEGYKEYLKLFILQTRQKGAIPVLITPVARNYPWVDGVLTNTHGDYPGAIKEVASETHTLLVDLNERSMKFFTEKGRDFVTSNYFMNLPPGKFQAYPEGKTDNTHFQPEGATEVARLVCSGLRELAGQPVKPVTAGDFIVADDGTGDFMTVQEAINAVPDFRNKRTTIFIKNGTYREKLILPSSKTNVTFIGENVDRTILTFDDFAAKTNRFGEPVGTTGSASFYIFAEGFIAENITFENSSGPVGQAVAVRIDGDRVAFKNCRFIGFQDTLYPHGEKSRQYYLNCYIEGSVDYIFGWSTVVFDRCTLFCKDHGYIAAPSTLEETEFGFVFLNCTITGSAPEASFYLGRPWRPYGKSVFIGCKLGKMIKPEGWNNWRDPEKEKTAFFAEYGNSGDGATLEQRVPWAHLLTPAMAERYTVNTILGDWATDPGLFTNAKEN
ncbi:MAG: hypothetical protein A2X22_02805 [Bacteroidetes bacterium GWF2_49_14]|nr:MAG: hypothetical protein A2X22_02805 [Bacteroidetes bacterium GWF2_49_14]